MLTKESKIRVLENFHSLDYIFFGKPIDKLNTCCKALSEEYIGIKGALSSLIIEMYKEIGHKPDILREFVNINDLKKTSRENAKVARENAERLVNTENGKKDIKLKLREALEENENLDIQSTIKEQIRHKAFSLAVDSLLVGRALKESKKPRALDTYQGKILEDSYKILRDGVVESALFILEANDLSTK